MFTLLKYCFLINLLFATISSALFNSFEGLWFLLGIWLFLLVLYYWGRDRRNRLTATVSPTGIKCACGDEIPFNQIDHVRSRLWWNTWADRTVWFKVASSAEPKEFCLGHRDIISLLRTSLNQWSLNRWSVFSISAGVPDAAMNVRYTVGKLGANGFEIALVFGLILCGSIGLIPKDYLFSLAVVILIISKIYPKISVRLDSTGVSLVEGSGAEKYMALADVAKVEKGIFRTKVAAKDGQVLYFPQSCYLFPELIREFAGLREEKG